MTTVTLPPQPAQLPPLAVDPGAIRACGADLLTASAQLDDLGTFVADDARVSDWSGSAATAYHTGIGPIGRQADAMSLALRGVAQRVEAHAEEMASLLDRRVGLANWRLHLVQHLADLRARVVGGTEDEAPALQAPALQAESDQLGREIADFDADVATWATDIAAEETAMNEAFARVETLEQVEASYGGATDPADAALATKPPAGASPAEVNQWWDGLTEEQQQAIIAAAPGAIGNLDGIPAEARDAANRVSLARDIATLEAYDAAGHLTGDEHAVLDKAHSAQEAIDRIEGSVDPATGEPIEAQVYGYDPDAFEGDGAVAIAAGNLDTADNIAVVVPGFGTDGGSAPYQADRAVNIYEATRSLDGSESNATMFWIGYDAPDNGPFEDLDAAGVLTEGHAEAGGERFADMLDGLRESRDGDPAHLTAIGHSYGSTTTGHAAHDHGIPVDDLVFVGSPGVGGDTNNVGDTGIDPEHVWAGANSRDPITYLGNHGWVHGETLFGAGMGDDPAEDDFGANRFRAEDVTRPGHPSFGQHSLYFDHDTESLHNIASIINGDYGDVMEAEHNYDPWWGGVQDPELDRDPTTTDTLDEP